MLRIAVCDDIDTELRSIAALANEYSSTRGLNAELRAFSHPDALLTVCEKESFHIFLLDMVMPMVSGLELGLEIRRISTDVQIIPKKPRLLSKRRMVFALFQPILLLYVSISAMRQSTRSQTLKQS